MGRINKSAFVLLISVIIVSIFVAKVSNLINISTNTKSEPKAPSSPSKYNDFESDSRLMHFVQISDIHVSIFNDPDRVTEFEDLLRTSLPVINPALIIASGDLTDARSIGLGSEQHHREWTMYYNAIRRSGITEKYPFLDIRGNHDTFNVADTDADANFFRNYSVQGVHHSGSYAHQVVDHTSDDRYTFLGIDASLSPGPKRPFNFIGQLSTSEISYIRDKLVNGRQKSLNGSGGDYLIWFGHYPTSCILTEDGRDIRDVIGELPESMVYLCGHLHTIGGIVPKMYSLQRAGYLELELGDWKDNRYYRVAAIDHGHFSFVDVRYNRFPIILITNPKNSMYHIPGRENPEIIAQSTHIRILAFSTASIVDCWVRINYGPATKCEPRSSRLYVAAWSPDDYRTGSHVIEVTVTDAAGRSETVEQPFSLDNSTPYSFAISARFMLMTDFCTNFQILFGIAYSLCVLPMLVFRVWHELVCYGIVKRPCFRINFFTRWIRNFWLLSTVNRLFLPLMAFFLYILIGPWTMGEIVDGHMGYVFLWGIFVRGTFIPGTLTYLYGFFQLLLCQFPLTVIYAHMVGHRYRSLYIGKPFIVAKTNLQKVWPHTPFLVIISVELVLAVFFFISYGTVSFVLGPLRTWSVILHIYLFYLALTLPYKSLAAGANVWSCEDWEEKSASESNRVATILDNNNNN